MLHRIHPIYQGKFVHETIFLSSSTSLVWLIFSIKCWLFLNLSKFTKWPLFLIKVVLSENSCHFVNFLSFAKERSSNSFLCINYKPSQSLNLRGGSFLKTKSGKKKRFVAGQNLIREIDDWEAKMFGLFYSIITKDSFCQK